MDIEKKVTDFKSLSRVASKAELINIYLLNCDVKRTIDALNYDNLGADISFLGQLLSENENDFTAIVKLSVTGRPADDNEKVVVNISSEYILTYDLKDKKGLTTDDIKTFCGMNSPYNIWPFWREFVQSISNRMDIPVLVMPFLKFRPPKSKRKTQKKTSKS